MIYNFSNCSFDFAKRTFLMGILNITPDSFADGGKFNCIDDAVNYALKMADEGADIIDIGGESTRPGSTQISVEEELKRVLPVIERLVKQTNVPISIDTYKSEVAELALNAGAQIVNDISGLHFDPKMAPIVARLHASLVVMHIKGTPRTMQANPEYNNLITEVKSYLETSINSAVSSGIKQIIIDPGIGFGKTVEHNLEIIKCLREFSALGYPIMTGPSRKSFIGKILNVDVDDRLEGTAAAVAACVMNGANIVRVHDVRAMKRVVSLIDAICKN
ncbi:MAG: dihydropteroate synthase [Chlorobiaceae bacterium]|nr:dihydropteroate synthase [Chlorobiaceae bacterium]